MLEVKSTNKRQFQMTLLKAIDIEAVKSCRPMTSLITWESEQPVRK
jgi:hypothetical protein